jgi:hypothetical protein
MRALLRRFYEQNHDWPAFRGLRLLKDKANAAAADSAERRFLRGCCDPVLATPPMTSNPFARVEVHTLVCHRHLSMYLTAVKSLLRFGMDVSVAAHDDGSLTPRDRALLEAHVSGIRITPKAAADREMEEVLRNRPRSLAFRRSGVVAMQLFDFAHFSRAEKVLAMDSDTLFLEEPQRLRDWAAGGNGEILHIYESRPSGQEAFLAKLDCRYPPHFCMGLAAFPRELVDLDLIEETLERAGTFDWWLTQNIFPVLIEARTSESGGLFLDPREYQGADTLQAGAVFRHYWASVLRNREIVRHAYIEDTRKVHSEISAG